MAKTNKLQRHTEYHRDGSVWAKGRTAGGIPTGSWKWFRKDGSLMRSGTFEVGIQVGKWTTYDKTGAVYKVTLMKSLSAVAKKQVRSQRKRK